MIEPVLDLDEALDSELVQAREMVVEWEQPEIGPVRQLGVPIKLSRTPGGVHSPAPGFCEHTRDVLADAGLSAEEIEALFESGAAAGAPDDAGDRSFMG